IWRYDQTWTRGKHRRYNGYVERSGGVEGERLRESLAAAIRDLLHGAQQAREEPAQHADNVASDRDSGTDSDTDGGIDDTPTRPDQQQCSARAGPVRVTRERRSEVGSVRVVRLRRVPAGHVGRVVAGRG